MIRAYSKLYLSRAQVNLGNMFDFAVNVYQYSLEEFFEMFLKSSVSVRFSNGDPSTLAGRSGYELVYDILEENIERTGNIVYKNGEAVYDRKEPIYNINKSAAYWTGWALAYYQWYCGSSFETINSEVSVMKVYNLYMPYHEMDILQFVDKMNELRQVSRVSSYIKLYRIKAGLSQKELAEYAEIPLKTLQQYEQKQKNINKAQVEYVIRLAKVLNCKPEELLELND